MELEERNDEEFGHHRYLAYAAIRPIKKNEVLWCTYGKNYWRDGGVVITHGSEEEWEDIGDGDTLDLEKNTSTHNNLQVKT